MGIFIVPFFYRYLVSIGSQLLKTLEDWRLIFWFTIPLIYGFSWSMIAFFLFCQLPEGNDYVRFAILRDIDMEIDDIVSTGPYFYIRSGNGESHLNEKSIYGVIIAWAMVIFSVSTMLFFGIQCYRKMRTVMISEAKFKGLQNQLFYALLIETLIPIVFMHIPVSLLFLFTILELDVGSLVDTLSLTTALFPAIDPLPTLIIIKSYRSAIIRMFSCPKKSRTPTKTVRVIDIL